MEIWKLLEKFLGRQKVKTQSLAYINSDEGVNINVNFKRTGNVVECLALARVGGGKLGIKVSSDFIGDFPTWANPDSSFGKEHVHFGNNQYQCQIILQLYKEGRFSILYNNLDESEKTLVLQFTYIVDDSNVQYTLGDVDGNGTIDEVDLKLIQNSIQGLPLSRKQQLAADINQDSNVNSQDYVLLKNQLGL